MMPFGSLLIIISAACVLAMLFAARPKVGMVFLILSALMTEFYWTKVMGGYVKAFHVISVLLFAVYTVLQLPELRLSTIFRLLIVFFGICLMSAAASDDPTDAIRSLVLPLILLSIAANVAISLKTRVVTTRTFLSLVLYGSLIVASFGIIQMLAYRGTGIVLTFTGAQTSQIVRCHRPPSFFTEADTFGKFLSFPLFVFLPFAGEKHGRNSRYIKIAVMVFAFAAIVNMTRSAAVGLVICIAAYTISSLARKQVHSNPSVLLSALLTGGLVLASAILVMRVLGTYEELAYRWQSLTSREAVLSDGSVNFRKTATEETVKGILMSPRTFFLGHGWGQSSVVVWGIPRDPCGVLFLNVLYHAGFFALLVFLAICYRILKVLFTISHRELSKQHRLFGEGLFFSFLCMLIASQLASMWIAPEFWLVIGCAMYFETRLRVSSTAGTAYRPLVRQMPVLAWQGRTLARTVPARNSPNRLARDANILDDA